MKSKRLTVIIPGYNNPDKWWRRCLDSVLSCVGKEDEVICIDDGSRKKPIALQDYEKKDSRVRVVYRKLNGGLSVARNDAMELAQGEYITFIDSDDEITSSTYEKSLDVLKNASADIVLFGVRSIWVGERLYKEDVPDEKVIGVMDAECVKRLFDGSLLNYAWNKVYRTSFLRSHRIIFDPAGMPCEDIIFVLECIMAGAKWATIRHVGINYYRTHATLLSRYKSSFVDGTRSASNAWRRFKESNANAQMILGNLGEVTEKSLMKGEWDNVWRMASPLGYRDKWRFLMAHKEITNGSNAGWFFIKKLVYSALRRCLYTTSVQRWHIKRVYPTVKPYK